MPAAFNPQKYGKPLMPHHPKTLGRYELLRVLGLGGMGTVFLAKQTNLSRYVAVKLLGGARGVKKEWVPRFELEIDALSRLHHPNIVAILDRGEEGETHLFYVMEFVEGAPLRSFVAKPQKFTAVIRIVFKVALALECVHSHGLVHRDLKPENILIDRYGEVKLTDFGIVKQTPKGDDGSDAAPMLTNVGATVGTAAYMAPEQMFGRGEIGPPADIFALGVVFHELLTGIRPEPDTPKVTKLLPAVPKWVDECLDLCLHIDPKRRFENGAQMKRFLSMHAGNVPSDLPPVGLAPGVNPKTKRDGKKRAAPRGGGGLEVKEIVLDDPKPGHAPVTAFDADDEPIEEAEAVEFDAPKRGAMGRAKATGKATANATGKGDVAGDDDESQHAMLDLADALDLAEAAKGGKRAARSSASDLREKLARAQAAAAAVETDAADGGFVLDLASEPDSAPTRPVAKVSKRGGGPEWAVRQCPRCAGNGEFRKFMLFKRDCDICKGQGLVYRALGELRTQRFAVWGMLVVALAGLGASVYATGARLLGAGAPLAIFGEPTLPYIAVSGAFAVWLIALWLVDMTVQQKWSPTDLLPSGATVLPVRHFMRNLLSATLVAVLLTAGVGVGIAVALPYLSTAGIGSTPGHSPGAQNPHKPPLVPPGLTDPVENSTGYFEYLRSRDSAAMVFVPAGPANVGTPRERLDAPVSEKPQITLDVPGFFIDRFEVTAGQFAKFLADSAVIAHTELHDGVHMVVDDNGRVLAFDAADALRRKSGPLPKSSGDAWTEQALPTVRGGLVCRPESDVWEPRDGDADFPMIFVTWFGAQAYAEWVGGRLPTEVEWEKAARGSAPSNHEFPWGEWHRFDACNSASKAAGKTLATDDELIAWIGAGNARATFTAGNVRLDAHDRSPFNVALMGGNVAEWCHNAYHPALYVELERTAPAIEPAKLEPRMGNPVSIRGGAFDESQARCRLRARRYANPDHANWHLGFRVVIPAPSAPAPPNEN